MEVEYRIIEGYPAYRVGTDGSVWSRWSRGGKQAARITNVWRRMKPHPRKGYPSVELTNLPVIRKYCVHRLVLEAFVGPCPPGLLACHKDGNPTNNNLSNLRWDTRSANAIDSINHGTFVRGEKNGRAKLTREDVRRIREVYASGEKSQYKLAAEYGVAVTLVSRICRRMAWAHVE